MQDRPTYDELLAAVERFLETDIVANTAGSRGFHARVAVNALRVVRRELQSREEQLGEEWVGLDGLLGQAQRPASLDQLADEIRRRNEKLCERIRAGEADGGEYRGQALRHIRRTVAEKLRVSDPGLLERSQ